MTPPHGYAEILAYYGDPKFNGAPDAQVDPRWEQASMVLVRSLPGIPKLYCHSLIVEPLRAALVASAAQGWSPHTAGCFAPRCKRGLDQVSIHTLGAAVDFDAADNGMIICPADDPRRTAPGYCTIPAVVVACFEAEGFTWGGRFSTRFDPMHFQLASGY